MEGSGTGSRHYEFIYINNEIGVKAEENKLAYYLSASSNQYRVFDVDNRGARRMAPRFHHHRDSLGSDQRDSAIRGILF